MRVACRVDEPGSHFSSHNHSGTPFQLPCSACLPATRETPAAQPHDAPLMLNQNNFVRSFALPHRKQAQGEPAAFVQRRRPRGRLGQGDASGWVGGRGEAIAEPAAERRSGRAESGRSCSCRRPSSHCVRGMHCGREGMRMPPTAIELRLLALVSCGVC